MPSDVLTNRHMAKLGMAPQHVSWSDGPITIHDVSKFFSVPIAEAAQKLCVCGSVLQRICKENGIARWPYRKVTAGKSAEEIIEEGIKELASNPSAYKVAEKPPPSTTENTLNTSGTPVATPASIPISSPSIEPDSAMNVGQPDPKRPARQQEAASVQVSPPQQSSQRIASAAQTRTLAQGNTPPQGVNQQGTPSHVNSPATSHVRSTAVSHALTPQKQKPASTLDDFKIGFPSKGLRRASTRWWGSSEKESAILPELAGDRDTELVCPEKALEGVSQVSPPTASSLLVRTRRKASLRGRSLIAHAVTRGYGLHRLGAKDAATLKFVFGNYLPKHWTSAFPPMP